VCDRGVKIGAIEIIAKASFFDVYADKADQVFRAFEQFAPNGVRLQIANKGNSKLNERKRNLNKKEKPSRSLQNVSEKPWRRRR